MTLIVRDDGFHPDDLAAETFVTLSDLDAAVAGQTCLHLATDADARDLAQHLPHIAVIRIWFGVFTDGRGFSLAMRLRQLGYTGRLRAEGHIIADQYPMVRRSGIDEVAISDELASRQPEEDWRFCAGKLDFSYQDRVAVGARPAAS